MMHATGNVAALGIIPSFVSDQDKRSLRDQLHAGYAHGGGVQPFYGFDLIGEIGSLSLKYPNDPPLKQLAALVVNGGYIAVFPYSWVVIIEAGGTKDSAIITRMD